VIATSIGSSPTSRVIEGVTLTFPESMLRPNTEIESPRKFAV
jgi:hypothetical protein